MSSYVAGNGRRALFVVVCAVIVSLAFAVSAQVALAGPGTLIDAGFESGADGATLASPPWTLSGSPQRAEYDSGLSKVGAKSAWITGPSTAAYGGALERETAGMGSDGAEIRFWLYADSTNQNRIIRDEPANPATDGAFLVQLDASGRIAVMSSRPASNGYASGANTAVGTYQVGWSQYRLVFDFASQTYTLSTRQSATADWTPLKAAGATGYAIPMRGTGTITATHGTFFRGYQNTDLWLDDLRFANGGMP